ncbi:hypothetical protein GPECTOR_43g884 [Gonium pectorale]|uniref:Chalcone-flavonone isomerase family protein n=1 Tax=Gonium pectorale TaxID=33097 RepID=A0A150G9E0_GONPE|nr:hypothetical protein GPECTOR_43g884 [Gonium pectorale]|eukprot:KXZ46448.1 hypothetical protein GPECTOR_43g884 [Gonium pectorale]
MVQFETRQGCQMPGGWGAGASAGASSGLKAENFKFWSAKAAPLAGGTPFASISSSILHGLGKPGLTGGRVEPATGYEFPPEFCYLKTKDCPSLAGLGVRSKKIIVKDVHVYALGIYVDAAAARSALSRYRKQPVEELAADQKFYDAVLHAPHVEKTLRLVISSRLVDRKKFLDALDERLAPRLKQGMEIAFTCSDNKKLVTHVAGKTSALSSPALCSSLFDIYLGPDPVSRDAKATFGRSLAATLHE